MDLYMGPPPLEEPLLGSVCDRRRLRPNKRQCKQVFGETEEVPLDKEPSQHVQGWRRDRITIKRYPRCHWGGATQNRGSGETFRSSRVQRHSDAAV